MKATCLCGAIEVVAADHVEIGLCHCSMCRRWSGGPLFAVHCDDNVQFNGAAPAVYRSSDWAERGFCAGCGTHLYYRLVSGGVFFLPAGLFPDHGFRLASQIFIDEKPPYYTLANDTPMLSGEQVLALFAAGDNP